MPLILEQRREALNSHDARRLAALFAPDYRSSQPAHPNRGFGGSQQVVAAGRLYMELTEFGGGDIDSAVHELTQPHSSS
jgi:hypothetical protein